MEPMTMVIIACVAAVATFGLLIAAKESEKVWAAIASIGGALMAGTLAVGMAVLAVTTVSEADKTWTEARTTQIASMANASEVDGESGVFVTRIEEKNVIRYVESHSDGSYSLEEVDADGARIREDSDAGSARMSYEECDRDGIDGVFSSCGGRYVFHVPEGTVSSDFSVDPGK